LDHQFAAIIHDHVDIWFLASEACVVNFSESEATVTQEGLKLGSLPVSKRARVTTKRSHDSSRILGGIER
jgi:hypothetical protein